MTFKKSFVALALAASAGLASAAPSITNPSFESGTLAGWTVTPTNSGLATVETNDVFTYFQGNTFAAELTAGVDPNVYTAISQNISLDAGDTFYGAAKWLGNDELFGPYGNDSGYVSVFSLNSFATTILFSASVATFGDYVTGPWTYFSFTAPTTGSYILGAGVKNGGDGQLSSQLLVDFSTVPVPEPEGMSLMLAGLGALALVARRRKAA